MNLVIFKKESKNFHGDSKKAKIVCEKKKEL